MPLVSSEMVDRSAMGTSQPTLSFATLTSRMRRVVRMTTSVSSDDGRSRWATYSSAKYLPFSTFLSQFCPSASRSE